MRHIATLNQKRPDLKIRELQLLDYLPVHPEEVVRRTTLPEKVWPLHFEQESDVVNGHVGHLRRRLQAAGEQAVATVRGVGFSLRRGADRRRGPPSRRRSPRSSSCSGSS